MAFLLPENIPSRNDISRRLQSVARAARDHLPEEVTVWLREEKDEKGEGYRFLVLLDPAAGILVLEAPPERSRQAKRRKFKPEAEKVRRQVEENMARRGQGAEALRVTSLPVANALALPDVKRGDALSPKLAAAGRTVLFAEDLTASAFREAVARILSHRGNALTGEQEKAARAAVNPEIIIKRPVKDNQLVFRPPGDAEDVLAVMDREQERLAEHLGPGYRRIRGVAGSGKTLVLLHRARFIADHFQRRVLLLCFNKALATALEELVGDRENVDVSTVDGLAYQLLHKEGKNFKCRTDEDWERQRTKARKEALRLSEEGRYHLVLVDEAQDLRKSHLELAYEMVKRGPVEEMDFVVAFDSAQDIYLRKTLWNPPDMTARGRSTVMSVNYRNTREILEFAMNFLSPDWSEAQLDPEDDYALVPPKAARRTGSYPVVVECSDFRQEARQIADRVRERLDNGLRPDDVAVLFGSKRLLEDLEKAFNRKGIPRSIVERDSLISTKDKVRISNVYQVKGLEFRSVFIGGANQVWLLDGAQDTDRIKSLLYVGMTRAQDELTVTFSGAGEVGEALRRAQVE